MTPFEKARISLQAALQLLKASPSAQAHNQVVHHLHDAHDLIRPETKSGSTGQPFEPLKPKLLSFSQYQRHATEARDHTQEALDELEFMLEEGISAEWVNSIADSIHEAYEKL
ncbi:hypothetical protein [Deinococcus cellulosilyticus]|uniref:Uncharacterized protein n=1 Tax=Deinococcus cellulosilyticus (strain DSM 18568 / NBRC 106333 / KACC 11606 / 5516J-15) TaxID=1223518 RepID=A0A511MZG4_DEIC1|nr:hypothetical protein [Deinococcus cellulosilyticus]GEM45932.1 hypothetical protein DC3_15670 [Deinococcus cellulosilyticus NBRC 106333 = KACC 11606]